MFLFKTGIYAINILAVLFLFHVSIILAVSIKWMQLAFHNGLYLQKYISNNQYTNTYSE